MKDPRDVTRGRFSFVDGEQGDDASCTIVLGPSHTSEMIRISMQSEENKVLKGRAIGGAEGEGGEMASAPVQQGFASLFTEGYRREAGIEEEEEERAWERDGMDSSQWSVQRIVVCDRQISVQSASAVKDPKLTREPTKEKISHDADADFAEAKQSDVNKDVKSRMLGDSEREGRLVEEGGGHGVKVRQRRRDTHEQIQGEDDWDALDGQDDDSSSSNDDGKSSDDDGKSSTSSIEGMAAVVDLVLGKAKEIQAGGAEQENDVVKEKSEVVIYPASHFVTPESDKRRIVKAIQTELKVRKSHLIKLNSQYTQATQSH